MKPIIFSTPMVQAILDGRKTQTRRVIKINGCPITSPKESLELTKEGLIYHSFCSMSGYYKLPCQPGDILWVRETWCNYNNKFYYKADKKCYGCTEDGICMPRGIESHITCELCESVGVDGYIRWRPSIHMPREAARIFLRVTNVRVERLWDITETDVHKEGFSDHFDIETDTFYPCGYFFKHTWNSLYAKRGYGWDTNPWVWVIEFEKINKE